MKRGLKYVVIVLLLIVMVALASLLSSRPWQTSTLKAAAFKQIVPGMTRAEVERLLGGPAGDYGYNQGGPVAELGGGWFKPPDGASTAIWADDEVKLHIAFDAEGKVAEVYRQPAFVRTPAKLSWRYWWNCYFK